MFQLCMDLIILAQIFYYGSVTETKSKKTKKFSKDEESSLNLGDEVDFTSELDELNEAVSII
jgi:hypothetical protein